MPAYLSKNAEDRDRIAGLLLDAASNTEGSSAAVLAFSGDLGAGKTTTAQAIARQLGIQESVKSPTFILFHNYPINFGRFTHLVHVDAYRLNGPEELVALGFADLLADPKNLIIIEWPERVAALVPENAVQVSFSHIDENIREVSWG